MPGDTACCNILRISRSSQIKPKPKYTANKNINFSSNLFCLVFMLSLRLGLLLFFCYVWMSLLISMIRVCSLVNIYLLIHYILHGAFIHTAQHSSTQPNSNRTTVNVSDNTFYFAQFHLNCLLLRNDTAPLRRLCFTYFYLYWYTYLFFICKHCQLDSVKCGFSTHIYTHTPHCTRILCKVI